MKNLWRTIIRSASKLKILAYVECMNIFKHKVLDKYFLFWKMLKSKLFSKLLTGFLSESLMIYHIGIAGSKFTGPCMCMHMEFLAKCCLSLCLQMQTDMLSICYINDSFNSWYCFLCSKISCFLPCIRTFITRLN